MATLVTLQGPGAGRQYRLGDDPLVIGRDPGAAIHLDSGGVARQHARVIRVGDAYFIEDLGSRNGTFVNGRRVEGRAPLADGDRVQIADFAITFRLEPDERRPRPGQGGEARLARLLSEYRAALTSSTLGELDLAPYLPPSGDALRLRCLYEFVRAEMELFSQFGYEVSDEPDLVERRLAQYPELAARVDLAADLLYEEYQARARHGRRPRFAEYRRRFPQVAARLEERLRAEDVPVTPRTVTRPSLARPEERSGPPITATGPYQSGPPQPALPEPSPGTAFAAGYRLVEPLGRGAFGTVWRGEAPGGVPVAIKLIDAPEGSKLLETERGALDRVKALRHPHLSPPLAFWTEGGRLVVVSELADGSLHDRLRECRDRGQAGLPPGELLRYMGQVAGALDYLHERGLVHRDIKPANILRVGDAAKLTDFGLAAPVTAALTSDFVGTPAYMAPEMWRGEAGPASDLFSLAVSYAELRCGRRPFRGTDFSAIREAILSGDVDLSAFSGAERGVLRRALAADPAQRPRTAAAFAESLRAVRPSELVGAGPVDSPMASAWGTGQAAPASVAPPATGASRPAEPVAGPPTSVRTLRPGDYELPAPQGAPPPPPARPSVGEALGRLLLACRDWLRRGAPPPEERPWPETVRRHTEVDFPAAVPAGRVRFLRIRLVPAEEVLPTGEVRDLPRPGPHDVTMALRVPRPERPGEPPPPIRVGVSVAAENFAVEGARRGELVVPWDGKSRALRFRLRGLAAGPGRVMIDFSQNGAPVGSVDLLPEVVGRRTVVGAAAPLLGLCAALGATAAGSDGGGPLALGLALGSLALLGGLVAAWRWLRRGPRAAARAEGVGALMLSAVPPAPPDVVVKVFELRYAAGAGTLRFCLASTHPALQDLPVLDGDMGTQELRGDVAEWVERQLRLIGEAAERGGATPAEVGRLLADVGHRLFERLLPDKLREMCWTLRARGVRTLMVLSDEPHIPWELIKPYRQDAASGRIDEEDAFWGESFALAHWLRGRPPARRLALRRVLALGAGSGAAAPGGVADTGTLVELPGVDAELAALQSLAASGSEVRVLPARCRALYEALERGGFDVLHLACHGIFGGPSAADASAVFLDDGPFSAAGLSPRLAGPLREAAPLVFLNACQSGRLGFALTRLGGWGGRLVELGCGGFLGALWPVTDHAALAFSQAFYERLARGLALGEAVAQARGHVRTRYPDDPSWLAYCCFGDPLARVAPSGEPVAAPAPTAG